VKSRGSSVSEVLLPYSEDRKSVTGSQDGTERFDVQNNDLGTRKHSRAPTTGGRFRRSSIASTSSPSSAIPMSDW
jgi:hypothetical protein